MNRASWISAWLLALCLAPAGVSAAALRIGLATAPASLDPQAHNARADNAVARHLFDSLLRVDARQRLLPGLAIGVRRIDPVTWSFKLRPRVVFADATPLVADDVIFSLERARDGGYALYLTNTHFMAPNATTVLIRTARPDPLLPNTLARIAIVSRAHTAGASSADFDSGKAVLGSGPYRLVERRGDGALVLDRNERYWGPKPEWTRVVLRPIATARARIAALTSGEVDLIEGIPPQALATLAGETKLVLTRAASDRLIYLHLDQFRDASPFVFAGDGTRIKNPFKDRRVRRALSMAIDRRTIAREVLVGAAVPAGQLVPAGFFGRSAALSPPAYDPEGARKLLAAAGYAQGFRVTLHVPSDRYADPLGVAKALVAQFGKLGLQTRVVSLPSSVYFSRASRGGPHGEPEFSLILVGWGSASGEAGTALRALVHSYDPTPGLGLWNRGRYHDPQTDKIIEQALVTLDDGQRARLLASATERAIADAALIPLHFQIDTWATRPGIGYHGRSDELTLAMDAYSK